jgi:hemerythrin
VTILTRNYACTVGVRAMDNQHSILMDTMNELRLAVMHGSGPERVGEVLGRLVEFTRMHFFNEEQLLEQYDFPGLDRHRAEHQHILDQALLSTHRVRYGEKMQTSSWFYFLSDAYAGHIEELDRQYGPWLNARGAD